MTGRSPHAVATLSEAGTHGSNEDVFRVVHPVPDETLCVLADGLGGHAAGRIAAGIAVETIMSGAEGAPLDRARLTARVEAANDAIVEAQRTRAALARMRTTLVLLHLDATSAFWLHCGDSRLYHVRGGELLARTVDHSLAQMHSSSLDGVAREHGAEPDVSRHALSRALGSSAPGESRARAIRDPVELVDGDRFLLCSDGFWERMDHARLGASAASVDAWLHALRDPDTGCAPDGRGPDGCVPGGGVSDGRGSGGHDRNERGPGGRGSSGASTAERDDATAIAVEHRAIVPGR